MRGGEEAGECVPSFLRKKKEPKKNLLAKNFVFRGKVFCKVKARSRRIGLYGADPPMGRVERVLRRVGVLCFDRLLFNGRKREGERAS